MERHRSNPFGTFYLINIEIPINPLKQRRIPHPQNPSSLLTLVCHQVHCILLFNIREVPKLGLDIHRFIYSLIRRLLGSQFRVSGVDSDMRWMFIITEVLFDFRSDLRFYQFFAGFLYINAEFNLMGDRLYIDKPQTI